MLAGAVAGSKESSTRMPSASQTAVMATSSQTSSARMPPWV
jgi:hypothetical protein